MATKKIYKKGEPCKKCGAPLKLHRVFPEDHVFTECMMCSGCHSTFFNKNFEKLKEKKEIKKTTKRKNHKTVRDLYFTKSLSGSTDLIERMGDVVKRYENGRVARQIMIRLFWQNLRKDKVKFPHGFSKKEVLEIMRFMADQDLTRKTWITARKTNQELREEYNEKKMTANWKPHVDGEKCYVCEKRADVRHHLVPLKHGGHNSYLNIRVLCNPCHAEIHPWLKNL